MMKISEAKKCSLGLLAVILFMAVSQAYARAGGGGGHGGGGGGRGGDLITYILAPIFVLYSLYKTWQIKEKKKESAQIIAQAAAEDPIWNQAEMEAFAKEMFFKMQQAWMDRDLAGVQKLISTSLYDDYKTQLDFMKKNHEKNMLECINVNQVSIISSQDYHDDSKDAFTAYIKGNIIDYTINEQTGNIIKNKDREEEDYTDTYYFIRQENNWILNAIKNDASLSDVTDAVNFKEA